MEAISKLATQNDRWLFIAMTVLVLLFAWKVITHLVRQNDQSRTAHMTLLESMNAKSESTAASLMACLNRNSEAMEANSTMFERCADELRLRERKHE